MQSFNCVFQILNPVKKNKKNKYIRSESKDIEITVARMLVEFSFSFSFEILKQINVNLRQLKCTIFCVSACLQVVFLDTAHTHSLFSFHVEMCTKSMVIHSATVVAVHSQFQCVFSLSLSISLSLCMNSMAIFS